MLRRPLKAALFLTLQRTSGQALGCLALDLLERTRLRPSWARLFALVLGASYERGRKDEGDPRRPAKPLPVTEIELDSDEPIPAQPVNGVRPLKAVEVALDGVMPDLVAAFENPSGVAAAANAAAG